MIQDRRGATRTMNNDATCCFCGQLVAAAEGVLFAGGRMAHRACAAEQRKRLARPETGHHQENTPCAASRHSP